MVLLRQELFSNKLLSFGTSHGTGASKASKCGCLKIYLFTTISCLFRFIISLEIQLPQISTFILWLADKYCSRAFPLFFIRKKISHSSSQTLNPTISENCNAVMFRGQLWEIDDFVQRTGFYKQVSGECSRNTYFFENYDMEYAGEQMTRLARFLLGKYGENIILIKTDLKDTYIDLDDRLQKLNSGSEDLEKRKQAILQYEKMFEDLTKCYVIDISKHYFASDKFPLGGAHIVHYEDEFYNQSCSILMQIFSGSGRKHYDEVDERYLFMRNQRLNRS